MQTTFHKYEGAGNDFILIDNRNGAFKPDAEVIARLCDRHFGVGADGLMTLSTTSEEGIVARMHYYNSDGSEGEMCGNGARCFALFCHHLGLCTENCRFRATDGLHHAEILSADESAGEIRIGMIPVSEIQTGEDWWAVNTGVPHYVEFVDDLSKIDLQGKGYAVCHDFARFPHGTNVNFVKVEGEGSLRMRTYERGVDDETLACGTGATAVAIITNFVHQPHCNAFRLTLPGGELRVEFEHPEKETYNKIRLTGPARRVFRGEVLV